jgi:hypothetical protein
MNKQELIGHVAEVTGFGRGDASRAVEAVFDTISSALKRGDEVRLVGFGTFSCSRQGVDGTQSAHRRADADPRIHPAQVQAGQGPQGCGQRVRPGRGLAPASTPPLLTAGLGGTICRFPGRSFDRHEGVGA